MSTDKKTEPSERPGPLPSEDNGNKKQGELKQEDLDRATGGRPFPLNPQPLPP
jgi:hypothetical protein